MSGMQRTQIYLEPELAASLDQLARHRGTSRAEIIRLAARQLLARERPVTEDPIFGIIGIGRSGATDVAVCHDDYLIESEIGQWRK